MISFLFAYSDIGQLVLRVALGAVMAAHGFPKIKNFNQFSGWLDSMGFKPSAFWAAMVIIAEALGGIALILGVFTQIAAFLIAINMLVAMAVVHCGKNKFIDGWEKDFVYFAGAVALIFLGGGAWSFDAFFGMWLW